jgi:hypothetical protein
METNTQAAATVVQLMPAQRVMLSLAATLTGMTVKAMERKIEDGRWLEGQEYFRDPDGRLWVDLQGVMKWVARGRGLKSGSAASVSRLRSAESSTATP